MTNKEIIVDYMELNLSYYHNENDGEGEYSIKEKDLEDFADSLLAKLQVLDRDNVKKLAYAEIIDNDFRTYRDQIDAITNAICQLIPKGEVEK